MADVVRQVIVDKIVEMARGITTANSFRTNVSEVNNEDKSVERIKEFPAINVIVGVEEYLNPLQNEAGKLIKTMNVVLDCYLRNKENKQSLIAKLVADLELRFCDDTISATPAYNLEGKALIVLPVRTTPFDVMAGENNVFGVEFEMEIKYRQSRKDPTIVF